MQKLLVTGGSGFLGRAVIQRLIREQKYEIIVAARHETQISNLGGVCFETVDLLNEEAVRALFERVSPDLLCHLAWAVGGKGFRNSEANLIWLEASLRMMRLFKGSRLIFAGSSAAYGTTDHDGIVKRSLYGTTKQAFELTAGQYCREMGIGFASGRIFTVYGPGDSKTDAALPNAIEAILHGETFHCNAPRNMWDYIYIDDAAEAMARLIDSDIQGVLDIGTGQPISMRQAFQIVANEIGCPDLLVCGEGDADGACLVADTTRLQRELHYICQTPFTVGVAKTIDWWREREAL